MRRLAILPLLLLAACDKPDNAPGPGGVTVGEAKALDEAAQMLEANRAPRPLPAAAPQPAASQPPSPAAR